MRQLASLIDDPAALNEILAGSGIWDDGPIETVSSTRIGEGFGFSGSVFRLAVATSGGHRSTLVAKVEDRVHSDTAVLAWHEAGSKLGPSVPRLYGHRIGDEDGLLLFEDISGTQGDDLLCCTAGQAKLLIEVVARLHVVTQLDAVDDAPINAPVFAIRNDDPTHWERTLTRARERYPLVLDERRVARLENLPSEIDANRDALGTGPIAWVHVDPHLDNVVWRADASPVLVDWSSARVGPVAVDVAALLVGLSLRANRALSADDLIAHYETATGWSVDRRAVTEALRSLFVRGMIGWSAGETDQGTHQRMRLLHDDAVIRVAHTLDWIDAV